MKFSRPEYWSEQPPFPPPGYLPDPGIEPGSPELQADTLPMLLKIGNFLFCGGILVGCDSHRVAKVSEKSLNTTNGNHTGTSNLFQKSYGRGVVNYLASLQIFGHFQSISH